MELLATERYSEYEEFVKNHPRGTITQSVLWHKVKHNWNHQVVVLRNSAGEIEAGMSVLIRKVPLFGVSFLYAPRGPVCDYNNPAHFKGLQEGVDALAKKHKGYLFKIDPDAVVANKDLAKQYLAMGYTQEFGGDAFENIQARFNYRLYIEGQTQEEIKMNFESKTRYNVRLAGRRGVEVKVAGKEGLDDFYRLMKITGQRDGFTTRSRDYFETMLDALGEHCRLYLAYYEGKAIAGSLATNYAGKTYYLYGCSSDEQRNTMATYLLQWEMIRWAQETGCTVYDLQGVSGNFEDKEDPLYGLFRFKSGFGGQVDELVGEFNYSYKPFIEKLINKGIALNEWLREKRRNMPS